MTTTTDPFEERAAELRGALVGRLLADGHAVRPEVAAALRAEPRHLYVPRFHRRVQHDDGVWRSELVDDTHPDWLGDVYTDRHLTTSDWPTPSSSSMPSLMADMLDALDAGPGADVIEIGTGTGYNAALLGRMVGDENVLSLDIVPALVDAARAALERTGHAKVTAVCVDGESEGKPPRPDDADRLIATCGVDQVPRSWLAGVRPGGRIVAPLGHGIVVLDVDERHGATGRFLSTPAYFMGLRPAGGASRPIGRPADPDDAAAEPCAMPLDAWTDEVFRFPVSFALPPGDTLYDLPGDGALVLWHRDGSIARITPDGTARQSGPRRLADILGTVWRRHQDAGRPGRDAYRVTVAPDGTHRITTTDDRTVLAGR